MQIRPPNDVASTTRCVTYRFGYADTDMCQMCSACEIQLVLTLVLLIADGIMWVFCTPSLVIAGVCSGSFLAFWNLYAGRFPRSTSQLAIRHELIVEQGQCKRAGAAIF